MNSNRFAELLKRYKDDTATREERDELMQLIRESKHDEAIMDSIYTMLSDGLVHEDMDLRRARKMLKKILTPVKEEAKIVPVQPTVRKNWRWVAAAAVLVIGATAGWWISRKDFSPPQLVTLQWKKTHPVVFTGKQFVRLPDGSTVLLNEDSRLSYSTSFGVQERKVVLTGEGYFDVQHDQTKPFKVITGKITTTVLGTAFNVKAYPEQHEIKVTVTRGKVKVTDDRRELGIITPDQQIAVNTITNDFEQINLKAETVEVWKSEYLILDDVSMEEAAITIGEKYNVKIMLANDDLKKCRISATFLNRENLDQVLTVVSGVVKATYTIRPDGNAEIEGTGCK